MAQTNILISKFMKAIYCKSVFEEELVDAIITFNIKSRPIIFLRQIFQV